MPLPATSDRIGFVIDAAVSSFALTSEHLDALRLEREKEAYEGMDDQAFLEAVSKPAVIPNPETTIPRTEWRRDELYNALLQMEKDGVPFFLALRALQANPNQQLAALAQMVELTLNGPLLSVNLENPKVAEAMGALAQIGLLTPEQYAYITAQPNPQTHIEVPSVMEQITGQSCVLTLEEAALTREG